MTEPFVGLLRMMLREVGPAFVLIAQPLTWAAWRRIAVGSAFRIVGIAVLTPLAMLWVAAAVYGQAQSRFWTTELAPGRRPGSWPRESRLAVPPSWLPEVGGARLCCRRPHSVALRAGRERNGRRERLGLVLRIGGTTA